jgi:maltose alpha-D-glucosyltransferase / alpha-amylase
MDASLPEIRLAGGWETLFDSCALADLEQRALPLFLPRQRWFGGKARAIRSVHVVDWARLHDCPTPAYLVVARVEFADGASDLYFLPLAIATESVAAPLARLTGPTGDAFLHDALADAPFCQTLLAALANRQEFPTQKASIRAVPTSAFAEVRGDPAAPLAVTLGPATSSNSLVFFGQRFLLKVFRRLEEGANPDFEIGRFLTERAHFARAPKMAGALEYRRPGADIVTLALLQELVPNEADGWQHALAELANYYERVAAQGSDTPADSALVGAYLHAAAQLGQRTAELHRALASDSQDPAFAPEPLTGADAAAIIADVRHQGEVALTTLQASEVPERHSAEARQFLAEAPHALARLDQEGTRLTGAAKIRCHGDYHLGQVLRVAGDFYLLDFEGEPTRSIEARRAKQAPLRDVAGMVRSLDYAAYAGLFAFTKARPDEFARLEPWAERWQRWTSAAFLREYLSAAAGAPFLPTESEQTRRLLRLFALGKAFYELVYELNNRPDWVRIPLRGLLALLREQANPQETTDP